MPTLRRRPARAVIYCRISLAQHGETVKVKRQEKLCRALAKRLGWDIVHVYCDNNKSAWQRNRERPDWDAMLLAIERGDIDAVIVYHGDRLIRQPWDLETLLNLADGRGIRLASPSGTHNLDDSEDRYRLRQDVAAACRESDRISKRTRDSHADRAEKGIMRRNRVRTFGYKRGGKVNDSEAECYRDAVARVLAGESLRSLARAWNKAGITTTLGNEWSVSALKTVLKNPRHAGLSTYKGEVVGAGRWKALVEREAWEAVQARLGLITDQHGMPGHSTTSKYLLTFIATHAGCGGLMASHHNGAEKRLSYRCGALECPERVTRNMANVDAFVVGRVLRRLADPHLWAALDAEPIEDGAGAQLAALEGKRAAAKERFTNSLTMTDEELEAILRKLDVQIGAVRERIAARGKVHVLAGCRDMSRETWDALPIDRRRAIVKATVKVEFLPARRGPGFDPESVRLTPVPVRPAEGESGSVVVLPSAAD